jgi:hypothetical protein
MNFHARHISDVFLNRAQKFRAMKNAAPWKGGVFQTGENDAAEAAASPARSSSGLRRALHAFDFANALFSLFFCQAVFLLQFAEEFFALPFEESNIVVGKAAPRFLELTLHLGEFAFGLILIHVVLLQ